MYIFFKLVLLISSSVIYQCSASEQISSEKLCEKWERNESSEYPIIYGEFTRVLNGTTRKCWVQDLTEEYYDEVTKIYMSEFIEDEPLTKYSGCSSERACIDESEEEVRDFMNEKASLVALTKDDSGGVVVLGFNILYAILKNECTSEPLSVAGEKIVAAESYIKKLGRVFETFQCDSYLSSLGLLIPREFRGISIGYELLSVRSKVAKALGFDVSVTLFTAKSSQKLATRAGFKELIKFNYSTFKDTKLEFTGIEEESEYAQLMFILADK